jgi:voltage-gated potassium channel Kch
MLEVLQSITVVAEEIAAVGTVGSVVIVVFAVAVQPLLAVTITEYVPALEILFVADVLPSFHK